MGTIVVGILGSHGADPGLVWALRRAAVSGSTVEAVHAWEPLVYGGDPMSGRVAIAGGTLETAVQRALDEAVAAATEEAAVSGVTVTKCLEPGAAAAILDRHSRTAELVVVTARHVTAASRLVHGSVTSALLHHAVCPVVVVPAGAAPPIARPARVLVGSDFTPAAQHAVDWATREAATAESPLIPVFVRPPLDVPEDFGTPAEEVDLDLELRLRTDASGAKDVQPRVLVGAAGPELARLAGPTDLMVVGSRGRGDITGWLLGSTSGYVVRHAPCPVVVVREHR